MSMWLMRKRNFSFGQMYLTLIAARAANIARKDDKDLFSPINMARWCPTDRSLRFSSSNLSYIIYYVCKLKDLN